MSTSNDNLYRFVKASERLPGDGGECVIRWKHSSEPDKWIHQELKCTDVKKFKHDCFQVEWLEKIEADQQEKQLSDAKAEIARRRDLILSEPNGIVRETMIQNLLIDL